MLQLRSLLLVCPLLFVAACASTPSTATASPSTSTTSPTANPCAVAVVYLVVFTPDATGYLAQWPSPPSISDTTTPGRANSQQVPAQGDPTQHDLGNQGPLVTTHRFSVHYSLHCDGPTAFWSLDCQDKSSRYADLWAHSDPCVWNDGTL
jgi:hypothetical protein